MMPPEGHNIYLLPPKDQAASNAIPILSLEKSIMLS
jgi:hypothetical protein